MLSSLGSVLKMSNISLQKFLLLPFCRGGQTAPLQWSWPGLSVTVCKAGRIGVSVGLGWLPHSSGVEKASLIHMHSLHLNLNCMSEWVWKVKSWGSSDMSDAIAVCSIQIQITLPQCHLQGNSRSGHYLGNCSSARGLQLRLSPNLSLYPKTTQLRSSPESFVQSFSLEWAFKVVENPWMRVFFRKQTILTAPVPTLLLELILTCKWSPFLDGCWHTTKAFPLLCHE